ncbi:MAG: hypothetical protein RLZZ142_38, partial [Verrucomicrobiota bacterium]
MPPLSAPAAPAAPAAPSVHPARPAAPRLALGALWLLGLLGAAPAHAQVNTVQTVAPNVYFHQGEAKGKGHCNNGWIVFDDYIVVIDANFPSGAREVLPKIRAISDKPIRFVFDTHHHGDHAYGNQLWHESGATPVAHVGVIEELKKYEAQSLTGSGPGRWQEAAKNRPDVAESRLKAPTILFKNELIFDDSKTRVELLHFGVAHTHGDGFAWMPKERILFTGDACVNGAFNYLADGNSGDWIRTLQAVQKLEPKIVCPGHGPMGGPEVLEDQIQFFVSLRSEVARLLEAKKTPAEAEASLEQVIQNLRQNPRIDRFIGRSLP